MQTLKEKMKSIIERAGMIYDGMYDYSEVGMGFGAAWTDPQTKMSFLRPIEDITVEKIKKVVGDKRALRKKNLDK